MTKTLFDKVWDSHVVVEAERTLLYVDLHLVHEVTSPQAFAGLQEAGRTVRRPDLTFATVDHAVPTEGRSLGIRDPLSKKQVDTLRQNCANHGVELFDIDDPRQGIVHVVGPELGLTQPGSVIVCGDSHTSTHGAFGALAFGIGTSEVEHVLATQTLWQARPKTMALEVEGHLPTGVSAKDLILGIIATHGVGMGRGHVIEYRGKAVESLSMEERMTVANMSIEAGARAGMIAPDQTTISYLEGKPRSPAGTDWDEAVARWSELATDPGAEFDSVKSVDASSLEPHVTWGINPGQATSINGEVPSPDSFDDPVQRETASRALEYMGLAAGTAISDIPIDHVFIGSCTNSRLEDLRKAARLLNGHSVKSGVSAVVVPGSMQVKAAAEAEGLDKTFKAAGFAWRDAGCSSCLAMNPDVIPAGERCASTSNRNYEGRQGKGARTHLVSPEMAVAAAVEGHFVDVRNWE